MFHPSEVELVSTMKPILEEVDKLRPKRVVFDSLLELRLLAGSPLRSAVRFSPSNNFSPHGLLTTSIIWNLKLPTGELVHAIRVAVEGGVDLTVIDSLNGTTMWTLRIRSVS